MHAQGIAVLAFFAAVSAGAATPWERYVALPTPENARVVRALQYSPGRGSEFGYELDDIQVLADQVLAEDPEAFQLAVRLYVQSDAGLAEDLGLLLGRCIRAHPNFFLRQVARSGHTCSDLSLVLNAPGLEYSDKPDAMKYELQGRRAALRTVKNKELRRTRDACLAALTASPN
jgi:hypothetical protein